MPRWVGNELVLSLVLASIAFLIAGGVTEDNGKYRLALAGATLTALLAAPFVWFTGPALRVLVWVAFIAATVAALILGIEGVTRLRRSIQRARRTECAAAPSDTAHSQRAKHRGAARIYLEAVLKSACPEVRFVD